MKFVLAGLTALLAARAWGSACCGAHAAIPSLITGFETARVASAISESTVIANAPADGRAVFRDADNRPSRSTLSLSGSYLFAPRWQAGAALPVGLGSDVGDAQAILAYEAVERPDILSASPKVLLFAQGVAPTGRSSFEPGYIDEGQITGQGFWRAGAGALALSIWHRWDFYALPRAAFGFARGFDDGAGGQRAYEPGWEGSVALGGGYALSADWRVGGSLTSSFAEGFRERDANGVTQTLSSSLWWPLELQVAWFATLDSVVALSYVDDTVVGPARNAVLSRAVSLQYSWRWGGV